MHSGLVKPLRKLTPPHQEGGAARKRKCAEKKNEQGCRFEVKGSEVVDRAKRLNAPSELSPVCKWVFVGLTGPRGKLVINSYRKRINRKRRRSRQVFRDRLQIIRTVGHQAKLGKGIGKHLRRAGEWK